VEPASEARPVVVDAAPAEPALLLREVARRFGAQPVLTEIELTLAPGEIARVEGANGAGKTTLLRIAAGLIAADAGEVRAFGLDPVRDRTRYARRIGLLSAGDRGLYARLSLRQNLEFAAALALVPRAARAGAVENVLARLSLDPMSSKRVDRLSTGQRQRVRLAGALLHDPELVLLDEPGASLDEEGLGALRAALGDAVARGGSVLWCSPSGSSAPLPFDRAYLLEAGRLVTR
jgi:ABC-2 type transport system ATP-binding protein